MKLFVDKNTLLTDEKIVPLLYPIFGEPDWNRYHDAKFNKKAYNIFCKTGLNFLRLTEPQDCDFIIFPYDYSQTLNNSRYLPEINHYVSLNTRLNKPILIFWNQDYELQEQSLAQFRNYYLFHTSFFKSKASDRVFTYPVFVEDSFKKDVLSDSNKGKPCVSFCGFAPPLGLNIGKYYFKELIKYWLYRVKLDGYFNISIKQAARAYSIKRLLKAKKIDTNFIIRSWSGFDSKKGMFIGSNDAYYALMRKEYFENIDSSDYVLCVRGNGNFSIRFYETLCHGKIPVFVDTDMALPFEDLIDWNKHAVVISNIKKIEKEITNFHVSRFNELQEIKMQNRKLWEEYFTPEGFFKKLIFFNRRSLSDPK
jgi:hypothetical protein